MLLRGEEEGYLPQEGSAGEVRAAVKSTAAHCLSLVPYVCCLWCRFLCALCLPFMQLLLLASCGTIAGGLLLLVICEQHQ